MVWGIPQYEIGGMITTEKPEEDTATQSATAENAFRENSFLARKGVGLSP